ncbi:MAG: hypothetical protein HON90_10910 [Halobacteriovoraceae bacterium]|jgi:transcription elongation GreA/GreB family factor|nr:hypothetical protein [Halobacteriovoraceae bacterium]
MDKQNILNQLIEKAKNELAQMQDSYKKTKDLVQNGDLKSDGKYDTRATEANYLAGGQRLRVTELEQELELICGVDISTSSDSVSIGSLVEIELNGQQRKYFIAPTAGGTMLKICSEVVLVISVFSPIGDGALGLQAGDGFEVEINGSQREYCVVSIS